MFLWLLTPPLPSPPKTAWLVMIMVLIHSWAVSLLQQIKEITLSTTLLFPSGYFYTPSLWFTGSSLLSISTVCPVLEYLLFIFYHSLSPLLWPDIFVMIVDWELLEKLMLKLRKHVHAIGLQGQCLLQKPMLSCKPILMYVW